VTTNIAPPWADLPPEVIGHIRPHLAQIVDEVIDTVGREVPAYRRPLEGDFGRGLRLGVEAALRRFLDLPGTSQPAARGVDREVYVALGRGELNAGRTLEALLSAYRVGARIAFRRFAELVRNAGFDADAIVPLAVATFAYIDELSSASIEGFAAEQSVVVGERDRLRGELVAAIVGGSGDPVVVDEKARTVGWPLPDRIVVALVAPERADGLGVSLGNAALVAPTAEGVIALLAEPAGPAQWEALRHQLAGRGAVVGLAGPWQDTPAALRLIGLAARLAEDGVLAGDPLVVGDRLVDLVVHRDAQLMAALVERELEPLDAVRDTTRQRLSETLLAWLRWRGERSKIAAALHVHPQTVAYRLGQLRERFGDALDDPDRRLALELALRARSYGT
jgi:hypothetical protein